MRGLHRPIHPMMSAWLLPEHIADVLPAQARRIEDLRRALLDLARGCGYELVMPPLVEHLESLLSGTGHALDLRTFKLIDQTSGRTLGVRADSTPQVARIDAHLLNRQGVARLCYCGPVLHTRAAGVQASREPLQFGAEIYGHAGPEADLEVIELALDGLAAAGVAGPLIDLGDVRIVRACLAGAPLDAEQIGAIVEALAAKDAVALHAASARVPAEGRAGLQALLGLYGDVGVIAQARERLPARALIGAALDELAALAGALQRMHPGVRLGVDLADLSGYSYYSGVRFAVYADGCGDALVRGGRYDEVGAVFGRNRPAVGFSLDLKSLAAMAPAAAARPAIRAPWRDEDRLRQAVRRLRQRGETVLCILPGHEHEADEFDCDRELVEIDGQWVLRAR